MEIYPLVLLVQELLTAIRLAILHTRQFTTDTASLRDLIVSMDTVRNGICPTLGQSLPVKAFAMIFQRLSQIKESVNGELQKGHN
jgi:hypothetical protein